MYQIGVKDLKGIFKLAQFNLFAQSRLLLCEESIWYQMILTQQYQNLIRKGYVYTYIFCLLDFNKNDVLSFD